MSDDPPANALMPRAANSDKQAREALVERYAPLIWSIAEDRLFGGWAHGSY